MSNQGNKERKIYLPNTNEWVPVTEEVYLEYYRPIWRIQKSARKNGQCVCPKTKLWRCDGDCAVCGYRAAGNTLSLDAPMENVNGDEMCLGDTISDPDAAFADIVLDSMFLEQLLDELAERNPDGKLICELIMLLGEKGREKIALSLYGEQTVSKETIKYTTFIATHFKPRTGKIPVFSDEQLLRLTMPILCVAGEKDVMLNSAQTADRMHTLLPNADMRVISGAGHGLVDDLGQIVRIAPDLRVVPVSVGGLHHHIICSVKVDRVPDDGLVHIADIAGENDGLLYAALVQVHPNGGGTQQVPGI